ncbi:MAG: FecR family protein, partial [Planctomycetota bacterium]
MDSKSAQELIYQLIDGTISEADFACLQDALDTDAEVRNSYLRAIGLTSRLEQLATESGAVADQTSLTDSSLLGSNLAEGSAAAESKQLGGAPWGRPNFSLRFLSVAAALMLVVGAAAFWLGNHFAAPPLASRVETDRPVEEVDGDIRDETRIAGHATLRRVVDLKWSADATPFREGDVLPNGTFQFEEGVAEIDFFCGATVILEGPARLEIESDWAARLDSGRLRASVPPAARGFVISAKESEIIDLGTEFAVAVGEDSARVEVIDGEVELRGGEHDGEHLLTGERATLQGPDSNIAVTQGLSTVSDLKQRRQKAEESRFDAWKTHVHSLSGDSRLIAYYPIAAAERSSKASLKGASGRTGQRNERRIPNQSSHGSVRSGTLVGPVLQTSGRFGAESD